MATKRSGPEPRDVAYTPETPQPNVQGICSYDMGTAELIAGQRGGAVTPAAVLQSEEGE
jgi:hypothetical protein